MEEERQLLGFHTLYPQFSSSSLQEKNPQNPQTSSLHSGKVIYCHCLGRHCGKALSHDSGNAPKNAQET